MSDENPSPAHGSPYQMLLDHCESAGVKFRADPEVPGVFFAVRGDAAIYELALVLTHDNEIFQVFVNIPVAVTDEKLRPLVAEFVVRANHRLALGGFHLDMDDGKLCFHIGHAFGGGGLDDETIGRLLATALGTADRYFPALMRVMFGGHTPADAVYLSELDFHALAATEELESGPAKQEPSPPPAKSVAPKKSPRRPRRDAKLKHTKDLPGLFDKGNENKDACGEDSSPKDNPPPTAG